jgi:hypothetical protein
MNQEKERGKRKESRLRLITSEIINNRQCSEKSLRFF